MTPTLRTAHRYIWVSLALLLPLGWLATIWAIPAGVWQTPIRPGQPAQLPLLVQSKQSGDFVINLRQDSLGSRRQIEVFIKKPQTSPNTTLLVETDGPAAEKKGRVLGLLGSRGIWRFELDSLTTRSPRFTLLFEDEIQHHSLRRVAFGQE